MAVGEAIAPPRSRRRALWIVAAAVLSISAGGVVALQRRAARAVDVAVPLTEVPTTVTAGTSAPAAPVPAADPGVIGAARPAEAADPLPASPPPGKTSAAGRPNPAARAPASKARAAKAVACDPPFTIDEQGHKHYKVDCL